jgi:hypothetical protein
MSLNHALDLLLHAQLMDSNPHPLFAEHLQESVMLQKLAQDLQSLAQLMDSNPHLLFADHQ